MFYKEVIMWKRLRHPNILSLLGVKIEYERVGGWMTDTRNFGMVSEWMTNGNVNQFVKAHRDANQLELVGFYSCC